MKLLNKMYMVLGGAFLLTMLPGCSFYNNVVNKAVKITHATKVDKPTESADKPTAVESVKSDKGDKKDKKETSSKQVPEKNVEVEYVIPSDREAITQENELQAYTSAQLAQGVVKGDWAIERVNGKVAVGEDAPFIKFVPSEKRIYGNNGCNAINGEYEYNVADSTIRFSNIASTMRLCNMDGITDYEINAALDLARYYKLEINGDDYYMYLCDSSHNVVMSLMHQNFDFLNGTWGVTKIEDTPIDDPDIQLVIDVDEGKLHGNTGCNIMNGVFEINMNKANSISFSRILTTRMACPPGSHQTELLVALEEASSAKPVSKTSVVLLNSQGEEVLHLERR